MLVELADIGCSFHLHSKVLICKSCRYGLSTGRENNCPTNHFREYHQADSVFIVTLRKIFDEIGTLPSTTIENPVPFDPPIPDLEIYYGWYCRRPLLQSDAQHKAQIPTKCQYLSRSTDHFMRHQNLVHKQNDPRDFLCQKVLMQTFFHNPNQSWFPVADLKRFDHRQISKQRPTWRIPIEKTIPPPLALNNIPASTVRTSPSSSDNETHINANFDPARSIYPSEASEADLELDELEEFMESYIGEGEYEIKSLESGTSAQDSPWLVRTGWPKHFTGCDLYSVALQTQHPGAQDEDELEGLFDTVVEAAQHYFHVAHQFAEESSHSILRWARSVSQTDCSAAPFRFVQSSQTFKRYIRYWTRFLCYICRSSLPYKPSATLLILNKKQVRLRESLIVEAENCRLGYSQSNDQLQSAIHRFFLSCLQQYLPGSRFVSPIIQYLACLGIDSQTRAFRQPNTYTPILAGFIYCMRIIIIYEANVKGQPTPATDILRTFRILHRPYLTAVSEYPFGEILNLLAYGVKCCSQDRNPVIQWTRDRQSLFYCGEHLEIPNIGLMIRELADYAYTIGMESFGWQESDFRQLNLSSLHDELGNRTVGYSFLNDIRNTAILNPRKILSRFLQISNPVLPLFSICRDISSPKPCPVVVQVEFEKLLHAVEIFLELLLVITHLACGQPPRGTELLSVIVTNAPTQQRHPFIVDGELAILTNYNKSQSFLGQAKPILRTLPNCISQLWVCYLAFTKPTVLFAERTLHKQLTTNSSTGTIQSPSTGFHTIPICTSITPSSISNQLFYSRQRSWSTDRMSRLLRYYTTDYLSFDNLSVSVYRHIAISIYRKHLQCAWLMEDIAKERQRVPIGTRQAGHTRQTSHRFYGIEIGEFNLMDGQIRQLFQETSQLWHRHFSLHTHILSLKDFPVSIYSRLHPPIGSKVPLRLYPFRRTTLTSISTSEDEFRTPNYQPLSQPRIEVSISRPAGFSALNYLTYVDF